MYYFFIEKKKYKLPQSLKDVKLSKYKQVSEFYELHKPKETDSERDIISYYIDFISLFLDIPKDELKKVKITSDEGFGITELYSYLLSFLDIPNFDEFEPVLEFTLDGIKYYCLEENLEVLNTQKPIENLTFEQYEDSVTILQNFDTLKYKDQDALSLLAGVLFRPKVKKWFWTTTEEYNSDRVKERADLFQQLDMHKIFSAYFFLIERINTSIKHLSHYSQEVKAK